MITKARQAHRRISPSSNAPPATIHGVAEDVPFRSVPAGYTTAPPDATCGAKDGPDGNGPVVDMPDLSSPGVGSTWSVGKAFAPPAGPPCPSTGLESVSFCGSGWATTWKTACPSSLWTFKSAPQKVHSTSSSSPEITRGAPHAGHIVSCVIPFSFVLLRRFGLCAFDP